MMLNFDQFQETLSNYGINYDLFTDWLAINLSNLTIQVDDQGKLTIPADHNLSLTMNEQAQLINIMGLIQTCQNQQYANKIQWKTN